MCNVNFRNMITTDELSENGGTENEYKELSVYPNPADQSISFVLPKKEQYKVQVITLTGKIMLEDEFNSSEINLNISSIESGLYFLKVIGSNVYLARFVKE